MLARALIAAIAESESPASTKNDTPIQLWEYDHSIQGPDYPAANFAAAEDSTSATARQTFVTAALLTAPAGRNLHHDHLGDQCLTNEAKRTSSSAKIIHWDNVLNLR